MEEANVRMMTLPNTKKEALQYLANVLENTVLQPAQSRKKNCFTSSIRLYIYIIP